MGHLTFREVGYEGFSKIFQFSLTGYFFDKQNGKGFHETKPLRNLCLSQFKRTPSAVEWNVWLFIDLCPGWPPWWTS